MADLKDILNEDDELRNEDLLKYLQGELPPEDRHKLEKQMADSSFVDDAVEGLQAIGNKASIESYVEDLNRQLHKQVATKKLRKDKRRLRDNPWVVVAVVVVLGLCILGYVVVRYYQKQSEEAPRIEQQKN